MVKRHRCTIYFNNHKIINCSSRQYVENYKRKAIADDEDSWSSDGAEQRNVASALLHLAGGSRKRGSDSLATPSSAKRSHSQKSM